MFVFSHQVLRNTNQQFLQFLFFKEKNTETIDCNFISDEKLASIEILFVKTLFHKQYHKINLLLVN